MPARANTPLGWARSNGRSPDERPCDTHVSRDCDIASTHTSTASSRSRPATGRGVRERFNSAATRAESTRCVTISRSCGRTRRSRAFVCANSGRYLAADCQRVPAPVPSHDHPIAADQFTDLPPCRTSTAIAARSLKRKLPRTPPATPTVATTLRHRHLLAPAGPLRRLAKSAAGHDPSL